MSNREIKLIYLLCLKGLSQREIKKSLKEKYNIDVFQNDINRICKRINFNQKVKYHQLDRYKILYLYSKFINTDKLIKYLNSKYNYGLTRDRIKDLASRYNVKKETKNMYKQSYIIREDEFEIVKLYKSGMSSDEIAKLYSYKTRNSILQKLEKMNVKRRDSNEMKIKNKTYNEFDIEIIDCEFKAYLIGLLLTDGYVNVERNYFGIDLIDEDCIKFLAHKINCKYSIVKRNGVKDKYRLIIYGRKYIEQLNRFSIVARKTFNTEKPELNKDEFKYIAYLLRGAIDGDGWIRKDGREFFICSASKAMITWYKGCLEYLGMEELRFIYKANEYNGIYLIRSARKENIEILRNHIYNNDFGMNRKYKIITKKDAQRL